MSTLAHCKSAMRLLIVTAVIGLLPHFASSKSRADGYKVSPNGHSSLSYRVAQATRPNKTRNSEPTSQVADGQVTLLNCSGRAITAKVFNADDDRLWVPTQTNAISNGQTLTLKCSTSTCQLVIASLKTEPLSGQFVYKNGEVKPAVKEAIEKGC